MQASRLLAILILLQNRGRMTAGDLAAEFEVSERTIYRDIDALSAAGVPVYGDRGPGGGFALLDGYRTRLTGLADDEAAALALAGVPSAARATGFGAALRDATGKLFAALPGEGGKRASEAAGRFHVDPVQWYRSEEPLPLLPLLANAVLEARSVRGTYASWTATAELTLDPLGLVLKGGEWYCAARSNGRISTYRVAGFSQLALLDQTFLRPDTFNLPQWWREAQQALDASLFTTAARIAATELGCNRLAALSPRGREAVNNAVQTPDGRWVMVMAVEASDHGARELLCLGPEIEVIAPAAFRQRMAELAGQIARLHSCGNA